MLAEIASETVEKVDAFIPERSEGLNYLEQLTATRSICDAQNAPYLYQIDPEIKHIKYAKACCKQWSCPECAISNVKQWVGRMIDGMNNLPANNWYLATITTPGDWRGAWSLKCIRANWHKLRKRLARMVKKLGEELFYVRVWEHHKDGSYHMHLITNAAVTTRWLKDNAHDCDLGYIAKMSKSINPGQAVGYVAKYMLKQSHDDTIHSYPRGARRIECSRNWVAWKSGDSEDWGFAGQLDKAIEHSNYYRIKGYKVQDSAILETRKRRDKKYHGKSRIEDDGYSNGRANAGEPYTRAEKRKETVRRGNNNKRQTCEPKARNRVDVKSINQRTEKPTDKNERILNDGKDKTRGSIRERHSQRKRKHSRHRPMVRHSEREEIKKSVDRKRDEIFVLSDR